MLVLIAIFLVVAFLIIPRNKLEIKDESVNQTKIKKSINKQLRILSVLLLIYACNILYNWGYFKQYEGPHTTEYFVAKNIECIARYSIGFSILLLICTIFSNMHSNKP